MAVSGWNHMAKKLFVCKIYTLYQKILNLNLKMQRVGCKQNACVILIQESTSRKYLDGKTNSFSDDFIL